MTQLIFCGISRNLSDPMAVQAGDFVAALEDGVHPGTQVVEGDWRSPPRDGKFLILDVPGVSKQDLSKLIAKLSLSGKIIQLLKFLTFRGAGNRNIQRLSQALLPAGAQTELLARGRTAVSADVARAAVEERT